MCEACGHSNAEAFCRQCTNFLCRDCTESHQRLKKLFPGHKIVSLEEAQESQRYIFSRHTYSEELLKMFCFDCKVLICCDCTLKDHLGYNHEFIKKAAPARKSELVQHLVPLEALQAKFARALEEVKETRSEIEVQNKSVARDIEASFEKLYKILDNHKEVLLQENTAKTTLNLTPKKKVSIFLLQH